MPDRFKRRDNKKKRKKRKTKGTKRTRIQEVTNGVQYESKKSSWRTLGRVFDCASVHKNI